MDSQYRIYAADYYFDFSSEEVEDYESVRYVYLLEPEITNVVLEEMVTLTITAPYKADSVAETIRVYQRSHPEVEAVWDTNAYLDLSEYLKNCTFQEELGSPVDPNTATWSELLDLALQWKEKGSRFSLMITDDRQSREDTMLYQLLLANLYDAEQADGSIQLDQPYLRELLEKWKELHGSTQLVGTDYYGDFIREDVLLVLE